MAAKISVLETISSHSRYLISAQERFPLPRVQSLMKITHGILPKCRTTLGKVSQGKIWSIKSTHVEITKDLITLSKITQGMINMKRNTHGNIMK